MESFRIFQSGHIYLMDSWRERFSEKLNELVENGDSVYKPIVINPTKYFAPSLCKKEVDAAKWDMYQIHKADLVVASGIKDSVGTAFEMSYAYQRGIPIIAIKSDDDIHPFHEMVVSHWCENIEEAAEWIYEKYLLN